MTSNAIRQSDDDVKRATAALIELCNPFAYLIAGLRCAQNLYAFSATAMGMIKFP